MADSVKHERIVLTYEDYLTLPNDGKRYEILEGELVVTPSPVIMHQRVSQNLEFILLSYLKEHPCGIFFHAPVDLILSNISVVVPDMLYISNERASIVSDRGIEGAPDLIAEILSPSTARYDRLSKMQLYAKHGIQWYWILDHSEKTLEVYGNSGGSYELTKKYSGSETLDSPLFPGLSIQLEQVWGQ